MKNIIRFQIIKPEGKVTIDAYNPDLKVMELKDILDMYLPYTKLFEHITIKNFVSIPEALLNRLTNQYLHGAEIEFVTPSRSFDKTYQVRRSRPFYTYKWTPYDLSMPMPRSLAEFKIKFQGKETTYLDAVKTLTSVRYIPNELWLALDAYSKAQIAKCRDYNRGDYDYAEQWFKELMKDCMHNNLKMFSPNKKTYFEAMAEIRFEKECEDTQLEKGLRPLNNYELAFLRYYAPAYGVEIPKFQWRINTRKTEHGYTEEPERVTGGMSTEDWNRVIFDPRNENNLPMPVRQNLNIREYDNDKLLRDAYFQLKWIMKHLKDEGLMPGYKRCPKCHEIYRESEGCECGYCQSVEFVPADNLFYGISSTYEDYEATDSAYDHLEDFTELE